MGFNTKSWPSMTIGRFVVPPWLRKPPAWPVLKPMVFSPCFFRAALMPRKSFKSTCRGTLMDAGELLMGRGPILETHRNFYWGWFTVAKLNLLMSLSFLSMKNPCPSNFSHGVWATILRLWGQSWGTIFDHLQKQPASTKSLPRTDVPD